MDIVNVSLSLIDLDTTPGLSIGESFQIQIGLSDLRNPNQSQSIFSGGLDVLFDPKVIKVDSISYDTDFSIDRSGAIDQLTGIVNELGATLNGLSAINDPTIATLNVTAIGGGPTTLTTKAGDTAATQITVFGQDGDQRSNTSFGKLDLTIKDAAPDLVASVFDAKSDHVLKGETAVDFSLQNLTSGAAGAFTVNFVYSDDSIIGNSDDVIVATRTYNGLGGNATLNDSINLKLPVATLNSRAQTDDPTGKGAGYRSTSSDYLGMIIDPNNQVKETNETNNLNQGKGKDKDDITYFPWDVNGSGSVTATDAIFIINRLGKSLASDPTLDMRADVNGSGTVTATDAIAVINRLGYLRNDSVLNGSTVTITGVNPPTITIAATDAIARETKSGETANPGILTLTRTGDTSAALSVPYTVSGTATNGTDYSSLNSTATFAAGSATTEVPVTPIDDTAFEGNETVILTLTAGSGYTLGSTVNGTVTIADNDLPTITVAVSDANAGETKSGETANPGTFTLTRTGITNAALNVPYTVSGTATNGTDYSSLNGTATFAAGRATTEVPVTPTDDTAFEGNETVILTLNAGSSYTLGSTVNGTVTIAANDLPNHTGLINDINKDGKHDIMWRSYNNGATHFWAMNGGGANLGDVDIPDYPDMAWHPVAMADFNNDGNMDIVWRYHWVENTGYNRVWLMNGNTRVSEFDIDRVADNNWHIVGSGDFNLDGNADILWRNYATGDNLIWGMNGITNTGGINIDTVTDLNQRIVGTGDFNGDGKSDILWRNAATGQLYIWFMNGSTKSSVQNLSSSPDLTWSVASTGDMNNDGKSDIVWRNLNTGNNTVWLMNGATKSGDLDIPDAPRDWNIVGDSDIIPIWTAEYFNNKDLAGTPTYTEGFINITGGFSKNWGAGAPPNTPVDNFSARFKTQQYLGVGLYKVNVGADDSVRVWIGDQLVIDSWAALAGNRSGYFSSSGGFSPVRVEYKEEGGAAALNYEIVKYQPYDNFGDPNGIANSWNASFYTWNGEASPIFDEAHRIGTVNLGSSVRGDGQWGMNAQNWGAGSPSANVPADNFAMHAYTRINFTAGHTYKVWVRSDDGYRMWAHKLGGGPFNITDNAGGTFLSDAYGSKELTFVAQESGTFDFHVEMFEGGGNAYFDLAVTDVTVVTPPPPVWENPLVPGSYVVTQEYSGPTFYSNHTGIDLGSKGGVIGGRVEAVRNGTVIRAGWDTTGYGNLVVVDHGDGLRSYYAHLNSISVGVGQQVNINTQVGTLGTTGNSTGPHLHLEVRLNNIPQNPRNYISGL